jgi:hypothetical protein
MEAAFAVHELPGDYSQEGKVTLVRRLVRGGLLGVVQKEGGTTITEKEGGIAITETV